MCFSGITPKLLTFEYYVKNKTYSEVNFICVYQVWSELIEKCPSKIQDGRNEIYLFFFISTSDRGDFPRIIVIDLLSLSFHTSIMSTCTISDVPFMYSICTVNYSTNKNKQELFVVYLELIAV